MTHEEYKRQKEIIAKKLLSAQMCDDYTQYKKEMREIERDKLDLERRYRSEKDKTPY